MAYRWRFGSQYHIPIDPVVAELKRIEQERGITVGAFLEEAQHENSVLHPMIDWDDSIAGSQWRARQAAEIIRSVVLVNETPTGSSETRAFVNVRVELEDETKEARFVSIETALAQPTTRQQVLARALKEAEAWQRRYEHLEELASARMGISASRRRVVKPATGQGEHVVAVDQIRQRCDLLGELADCRDAPVQWSRIAALMHDTCEACGMYDEKGICADCPLLDFADRLTKTCRQPNRTRRELVTA